MIHPTSQQLIIVNRQPSIVHCHYLIQTNGFTLSRFFHKIIAQHKNVSTAIRKRGSMPRMVRWKYNAPAISPHPNSAPSRCHFPQKMRRRQAMSSRIPIHNLPVGSIQSLVNNATDSGCAVNLKKRVCPMINAGMILSAR